MTRGSDVARPWPNEIKGEQGGTDLVGTPQAIAYSAATTLITQVAIADLTVFQEKLAIVLMCSGALSNSQEATA